MGFSKKNPKRGGCKNVLKKTHVEFPRFSVVDTGISKGCHTMLQNSQEQKLAFSGVSQGKLKNKKIPGGASEKYILNTPCLDFFWNSPINLLQLVEIRFDFVSSYYYIPNVLMLD